MSSSPHELVLFFGRFHPGLIHLPIGGLVLLGMLELLAKFPRFKGVAQSNGIILGLVAVTAVGAALLGWMLSQAGGYDQQLLPWHKWTGFAVAATCTLAWLLNWRGWSRAYRICLLAALAMLVITSHFGGSITHGRDFLTQFAPGPLRALLRANDPAKPLPGKTIDPNHRGVFADLIQPILERRCVACHGPEKHKGDLFLDSYKALLQGGTNGPALIAGKAFDSPIIQRLLLPVNEDDHMPPDGKPQPTLAEIAALQWWIESGAPADKTLDELKPGPEVLRILNAAKAAPE